jgi:hypothetical protein
MVTRIRLGLLAAVLSLLAACSGGGSGSNDTTPPPAGGFVPPPAPAPSPSAEDIANARSSQLKVSLRSDTKEVTITWTDTFSAETGYTVESRLADGAWQIAESLPAGTATGTPYEWKRNIDSSRTYRISATKGGYSMPLETPEGKAEIALDLSSAPMTIEVDQTPPVTGTVQLSLANAVDVTSVGYFVDLNTIASSSAGPQFPVSWNSGDVTDGDHLLLALVQQSSGATIEVRRQIAVDNPNVAISLNVGFTQLNPCCVYMSGRATAAAGVQQIEFFVNGAPVHVITNPAEYYKHEIDKFALPGGTNNFRVVATDGAGATAEATAQLVIDNRPVLTLTSPADGAIVTDNLRVEGTLVEDYSTVEMTVSLGSVQIHQTSAAGAFGFDYSLAGLPAGEYTLMASAHDAANQYTSVSRTIIVPPSELVYELVATGVSALLDTDQGALLYKKADETVVLRSAAGVETTLQVPAGLRTVSAWQLSSGRVVMAADDPVSGYHIYTFAPNGQAINLSQQVGSHYNFNPVLKGPWVVWFGECGASDCYRMYNLDTQQHRPGVTPPAAASSIFRSGFDLVTTPGAEQLVYPGSTGTSSNPIYDLFRYDLTSQTTEMLTGGDGNYGLVQTDNARLIWIKKGPPVFLSAGELLVAPLANPTAPTVLSLTAYVGEFALRDGLVAWREGSRNVRVNDGATTTLVATNNAWLLDVADGRVTLVEGGALKVWTSGGGTQTLLTRWPTTSVHDDGILFIGTGYSSSKSVYRIVLP